MSHVRTYHDVEAVTRLLEEKERDLELAAHIGQELLQRNKESDEKVMTINFFNIIFFLIVFFIRRRDLKPSSAAPTTLSPSSGTSCRCGSLYLINWFALWVYQSACSLL